MNGVKAISYVISSCIFTITVGYKCDVINNNTVITKQFIRKKKKKNRNNNNPETQVYNKFINFLSLFHKTDKLNFVRKYS